MPVKSKKHADYFEALDTILQTYNKGGFKIAKIEWDSEYRAMMNKVSDQLDVEMNYTNAQDHVPLAERNNHTIKENIRTALHNLPFNDIPKVMLSALAGLCTERLKTSRIIVLRNA